MEFTARTRVNGLSRVCFGCEQLGGADWGRVDIEEISAAVKLAPNLGINFFDTAGIYGLGRSELRLSAVLGRSRHKMTIATKGGLTVAQDQGVGRATVVRESSAKAIRRDIEESLRRLRIGQIPVYYLHWPDSTTPIEETMGQLRDCRNAGKIKHIGLSNFNIEQVKAAQLHCDIDIVQLPFSLLSRQSRSLIGWCAEQGIMVCAYGVLAQGLLSGRYTARAEFGNNDRRHRLPHFSTDEIEEHLTVVERVRAIAEKLGRSMVQVAIRYVVQYAGISSAVVGIKSRSQLLESIDIFDWELTQEQIAFLEGRE